MRLGKVGGGVQRGALQPAWLGKENWALIACRPRAREGFCVGSRLHPLLHFYCLSRNERLNEETAIYCTGTITKQCVVAIIQKSKVLQRGQVTLPKGSAKI